MYFSCAAHRPAMRELALYKNCIIIIIVIDVIVIELNICHPCTAVHPDPNLTDCHSSRSKRAMPMEEDEAEY